MMAWKQGARVAIWAHPQHQQIKPWNAITAKHSPQLFSVVHSSVFNCSNKSDTNKCTLTRKTTENRCHRKSVLFHANQKTCTRSQWAVKLYWQHNYSVPKSDARIEMTIITTNLLQTGCVYKQTQKILENTEKCKLNTNWLQCRCGSSYRQTRRPPPPQGLALRI